MEDLIKQLQERAGLSEEQAVKSLETIMDYIKAKVPPMMHPMIDQFLSENKDSDDPLGDMMKNFGG